jgi:3-dehydroquinate dehydratase-2
MNSVLILNGSNLNMLGKREPHLYGTTTLAEIEEKCLTLAKELGLDCRFRQTNHEGEMVDWLQEAFDKQTAVIINPAGFSFGSMPILDALKLIEKPLIEVHITNIHKRDKLYQHSLVSTIATGVICGLGPEGYLLAMRAVASSLAQSAR